MHPRLVAAVVLAACGSAPVTPSAPGLPPTDVRYTVELDHVPVTTIRITVETTAAPDGITTFEHDTWGGVDNTDEVFHAVTAMADGRPAKLEHAEHAWVVHSAPKAPLALTYVLAPAGAGAEQVAKRFFPFATAHVLHLFGNNALVYPTHLDDDRPLKIGLSWIGFSAAGWTTLSSWGTADSAIVDAELEEFLDAVFLASDRMSVTRRPAGGATLVAATVGEDWGFPATELADVTARLMDTEAALFADSFPSYFLADLVPFHADGFTGGSALHDAFTAQANPKSFSRGDMAWLFAHELFHTWNGRVIQPDVDDGDKWFTEGFTSFYARRMVYRAGLATIEDYARDLDEELRAYMMSPARNAGRASADEAGRAFWQSSHAEMSSYYRGDLIAVVVDREIRRVSSGKRSLDDVMRDLLADAKAGGKINTAKLLARFERETSPRFAAKLRGVIEHGETIEIDPDLYAPCLRGELRELPRFDLGFDFGASEKAHRVIGLRADSPAAQQGMHEGDELRGWSFYNDRVDQTVKMTIVRGGVEREIPYTPKGEPVRVPVFEPGDPSACAAAGL